MEDLAYLLIETSKILMKDFDNDFFSDYTPYSTSFGIDLKNIQMQLFSIICTRVFIMYTSLARRKELWLGRDSAVYKWWIISIKWFLLIIDFSDFNFRIIIIFKIWEWKIQILSTNQQTQEIEVFYLTWQDTNPIKFHQTSDYKKCYHGVDWLLFLRSIPKTQRKGNSKFRPQQINWLRESHWQSKENSLKQNNLMILSYSIIWRFLWKNRWFEIQTENDEFLVFVLE